MPPKKPAEPSKKTDMKKKEKIIEVIVSARCKVTQALRLRNLRERCSLFAAAIVMWSVLVEGHDLLINIPVFARDRSQIVRVNYFQPKPWLLTLTHEIHQNYEIQCVLSIKVHPLKQNPLVWSENYLNPT